MNFNKALFFLFLFGLGAQSCSVISKPREVDLREFDRVSEFDVEAIERELWDCQQGVERYRLALQGQVTEGLAQRSFRQIVVAERPERVRIELFAPGVEQLLFLFVADRGFVKGVDFREKKSLFGDATPSALGRALGLPLSPDEIALWFTGRIHAPLPHEVREKSWYRKQDGGGLLLRFRMKSEDRRWEVFFPARTEAQPICLFDELRVSKGGELLLEAKRDGRKVQDRLEFPQRLTFQHFERKVRGEYELEKVVVQPERSARWDRLFDLRPPPTFPLYQLPSE